MEAGTYIFRSPIRKLMLSFPENVFGLGTDHRGDLVPYPNIHFDNGMYATQSEKLIALMRKHRGNQSNGGDAFWEEDPADTLAVQLAAGEVVVLNQRDPITEAEQKILFYLERAQTYCNDKQADKVCEHLDWMTERFNMHGLPKASPDLPLKRLRARITDYLGALEDAGLWTSDEAELKGASNDRGRDTERSEVSERTA